MKTLVKRKYGTYQAKIRLNSCDPIIYRSLDTKNRAVAKKRLDDLYDRLELEREGMVLPESVVNAQGGLIVRQLSLYLSDLETTATSSDYIDRVGQRIQKVCRECDWKFLKHVNPSAFMQWRTAQDLQPKTKNDYLSALNCFLGWLVDSGFAVSNPLEKVKRVSIRGRHRFSRRALTAAEIKKLLAVSSNSRKRVYILALTTGLRRGELASLQYGDMFISGVQNPYLRVRASTTKNGKEALVYLHPDALDVLRNLPALRPDEYFLTVPKIGKFKSDLEQAGIEYENSRHERVDFHSLRHTFCTRLAVSGVSPQIAKEAMRHSDISLTTNIYTDSGQLPISAAVFGMPSLYESSPQIPPQNATKTENHMKIEIMKYLAQSLGLEGIEPFLDHQKMVEMGGIEPPSE